MRKKIKARVHNRICEHLYNTTETVKVTPKQGLFNMQCFDNAVEYARVNAGDDINVVMGVTVSNGIPTLHFWNELNGEHLETTLGHTCKKYAYYPMRTIDKVSWDCICTVFEDALDYWHATHTTWFERLFMDRVV